MHFLFLAATVTPPQSPEQCTLSSGSLSPEERVSPRGLGGERGSCLRFASAASSLLHPPGATTATSALLSRPLPEPLLRLPCSTVPRHRS